MVKFTKSRIAVAGALVTLALTVTAANASAAATAHAQYHPTKAAFVHAADANCAALGRLLAPLGNPKTLPGIAHKLAIAVPAFTMALRAQAELGAPAGEEALVQRWMASMTSYGHVMAAIGRAAAAGNGTAVTSANTRLGSIAVQAAGLSKQLALKVCFQS